jgi:dTDP-4-dehydrorhamnose reductase
MRALLLGAAGMLARDLIREAPAHVELIAPTEGEADVTSEAAMRRVIADTAPQLILNCAAYTNVDGAETNREKAFLVNGEAPGVIGRAALQAGGGPLVLHYSTDYVFDGRERRPYREDDPIDPLGAYGESKWAGERALAGSGARYLIVRTQWLFGVAGRSFPRTMWERATGGHPTRVVRDQVGRPTYTVDLARATWQMACQEATLPARPGEVLHVANHGHATWYDVALRVFRGAGASDLVTPCSTADYPTPARRPAYSVLDTSRHEAMVGSTLPRWEDAVDRFLVELRNA